MSIDRATARSFVPLPAKAPIVQDLVRRAMDRAAPDDRSIWENALAGRTRAPVQVTGILHYQPAPGAAWKDAAIIYALSGERGAIIEAPAGQEVPAVLIADNLSVPDSLMAGWRVRDAAVDPAKKVASDPWGSAHTVVGQ